MDHDLDADLKVGVGQFFGPLHSFRTDGAAGFLERTGTANPFAAVYASTTRPLTPPNFTDLDGDLDMIAFTAPNTLLVYLQDASGAHVFAPAGANPLDLVAGLGLDLPASFDIDGAGSGGEQHDRTADGHRAV